MLTPSVSRFTRELDKFAGFYWFSFVEEYVELIL